MDGDFVAGTEDVVDMRGEGTGERGVSAEVVEG